MKLRKPKGILFDLDGTLVDSLSLTFEAFNHAFQSLGGRTHSPEEISSHFGPGEDVIFGRILGEDRSKEAYHLYCSHFGEQIARAPVFDAIPNMLKAFKDRGVRMSIFTGRSSPTTEQILAHHRFYDHFEWILTNDRIPKPKPHPDGIFLAAEKMGLKPSELWMVGDSFADMESARAAGAFPIGALWDSRASQSRLVKAGSGALIHHPLELVTLWDNIP